MNKIETLVRLVFVALILAMIPLAQAAAPVKGAKPAPAAQASLREVPYVELENKIGSKLVIHTTNDTTRSGTLLRYTNVTLTVKLGAESGAIELGVPRTTIRKVFVEIAPADPLFLNEKTPQEGESGAKKN